LKFQLLSKRNHKVGLLDLDLRGPSAHLVLGAEDVSPKEEKGVVPPEVQGIKFMSAVYYSEHKPTFLRGAEISNSIRELLAITRWGSLDYLLIDMPPGTGEEILDVIRFIKKSEFLVITTSSRMALETVKKLLRMLEELDIPIAGIIENMKTAESPSVEKQIGEFKAPFLGQVRYDRCVEDSIGDVNKLLETNFAKDVENILDARILRLSPDCR
jgi:ATP-binding protein involved in chromosome partitioning